MDPFIPAAAAEGESEVAGVRVCRLGHQDQERGDGQAVPAAATAAAAPSGRWPRRQGVGSW